MRGLLSPLPLASERGCVCACVCVCVCVCVCGCEGGMKSALQELLGETRRDGAVRDGPAWLQQHGCGLNT